ncbi:MAG: TnsA endonuclease C-terminal domain-containing protein [Pyrinomonadaceae bacterium]
MAKWRVLVTKQWIDAQIKEGRGTGEGEDYKPWITIRDFPSLGRVHRVWGWKTNRVHHLLSDLELKVFLQFLWPKSVKDYREQFPLLPLEETIEIAREMGVRHPTDPRTKHPIVMSTDMVLTVGQRLENTCHPYTVKYMKDLGKLRATEKLEIERRYWAMPYRSLQLKIMTEQQVSNDFVWNMLWVLPFYEIAALYPLTELEVDRIASVLTQSLLHENLPLRTVAQKCDRTLRLDSGTSLAVIRHLISRRYWEVEITKRIRTNERLVLLNSTAPDIQSRRRLVA